MKTKHVAARLSHLNINKIERYFNQPTIRQLIEGIIELSEKNSYIKNKILEKLEENQALRGK